MHVFGAGNTGLVQGQRSLVRQLELGYLPVYSDVGAVGLQVTVRMMFCPLWDGGRPSFRG